jgi:hypothetical protein
MKAEYLCRHAVWHVHLIRNIMNAKGYVGITILDIEDRRRVSGDISEGPPSDMKRSEAFEDLFPDG